METLEITLRITSPNLDIPMSSWWEFVDEFTKQIKAHAMGEVVAKPEVTDGKESGTIWMCSVKYHSLKSLCHVTGNICRQYKVGHVNLTIIGDELVNEPGEAS